MADFLEEMIGVFGDHRGLFGEGAIADGRDRKVAVVTAAAAKGDVDVSGLGHGELRSEKGELRSEKGCWDGGWRKLRNIKIH